MGYRSALGALPTTYRPKLPRGYPLPTRRTCWTRSGPSYYVGGTLCRCSLRGCFASLPSITLGEACASLVFWWCYRPSRPPALSLPWGCVHPLDTTNVRRAVLSFQTFCNLFLKLVCKPLSLKHLQGHFSYIFFGRSRNPLSLKHLHPLDALHPAPYMESCRYARSVQRKPYHSTPKALFFFVCKF